jgi:hypothetical protein
MASAVRQLQRLLEGTGLGELAEDVWDRFLAGWNEEAIYNWMVEQDAYQREFSGLVELRNKGKAAGMTEGDYLQERDQMQTILRRTGFGGTMFDDKYYLNDVLGNEVSVDEFESRIGMAQQAADTLPPDVRAELRTRYGINDRDVVSYYLDTDRVEADLVRQQQASYLAAQYGRFQPNKDRVSNEAFESLARRGVDPEQAAQLMEGLGSLGRTLNDRRRLEGAYGWDAAMNREREGRGAAFAGGGGAQSQQEGVTGLGSATAR